MWYCQFFMEWALQIFRYVEIAKKVYFSGLIYGRGIKISLDIKDNV